jgi:plasmid stabilization system protein ParE
VYVVSPQAAIDLQDIASFVFDLEMRGFAHVGAAEAVVARLRSRIERLGMGLVIPHRRRELHPDLQFVSEGKWMIALDTDRRVIVRIFHAKSNKNAGL